MSKTKQRKNSMYQLGYVDALNGRGVRYTRNHDFFTHYRRGYNTALREQAELENRSFREDLGYID